MDKLIEWMPAILAGLWFIQSIGLVLWIWDVEDRFEKIRVLLRRHDQTLFPGEWD